MISTVGGLKPPHFNLYAVSIQNCVQVLESISQCKWKKGLQMFSFKEKYFQQSVFPSRFQPTTTVGWWSLVYPTGTDGVPSPPRKRFVNYETIGTRLISVLFILACPPCHAIPSTNGLSEKSDFAYQILILRMLGFKWRWRVAKKRGGAGNYDTWGMACRLMRNDAQTVSYKDHTCCRGERERESGARTRGSTEGTEKGKLLLVKIRATSRTKVRLLLTS